VCVCVCVCEVFHDDISISSGYIDLVCFLQSVVSDCSVCVCVCVCVCVSHIKLLLYTHTPQQQHAILRLLLLFNNYFKGISQF